MVFVGENTHFTISFLYSATVREVATVVWELRVCMEGGC